MLLAIPAVAQADSSVFDDYLGGMREDAQAPWLMHLASNANGSASTAGFSALASLADDLSPLAGALARVSDLSRGAGPVAERPDVEVKPTIQVPEAGLAVVSTSPTPTSGPLPAAILAVEPFVLPIVSSLQPAVGVELPPSPTLDGLLRPPCR